MKKIFLGVLLTLTITIGLSAQRRGGPGRPGEPTAALKDALGLTDAQVDAIKALIQAERTKVEAIRTEVQQKHQTLETLLNAATPNALDVGNAAIALHAAEAKIQAERTSLINQIKQQLTGDQQQKLETLLAANGGRGLPFLGLGGPGPRGGRPPPVSKGDPFWVILPNLFPQGDSPEWRICRSYLNAQPNPDHRTWPSSKMPVDGLSQSSPMR